MKEYVIQTGWNYIDGKRFVQTSSVTLLAKTLEDAELACMIDHIYLSPVLEEQSAKYMGGLLGSIADKEDKVLLN